MENADVEYNLAKRYVNGDCTDVQLNYLISQSKLDKIRVQQIVKQLEYTSPMANTCKFLILCMMGHFFLCFVYAIHMHYFMWDLPREAKIKHIEIKKNSCDMGTGITAII